MIEIKHVSKRYPATRGSSSTRAALLGVDVSVARGDCVAVVGPNGAGKSTLLRLLASAAGGYEGSITVGGVELGRHPRAARKIGYVGQSDWLDLQARVRHELVFHARLQRVVPDLDGPHLGGLIDDFGLRDHLDKRIATLSGGTRRRLTIVMALLHRPDVLVLDEPTNGLDPEVRASIWQRLAHFNRERGLTILFSTHVFREVEEYASRIVVLRGGEKVVDDTPPQLARCLSADVLTLQVGGDQALSRTTLDPLLAAIRPFQPFYWSRHVAKLSAPPGTDPRTARDRVLRAFDAAPVPGLVVSFGKATLEDAYLRSIHQHDMSTRDETAP